MGKWLGSKVFKGKGHKAKAIKYRNSMSNLGYKTERKSGPTFSVIKYKDQPLFRKGDK
jgi:hypothetical protein